MRVPHKRTQTNLKKNFPGKQARVVHTHKHCLVIAGLRYLHGKEIIEVDQADFRSYGLLKV